MASPAKGESKDRKVRDRVERAPREELTAQQLRGITALIDQPTIAAAAKQIGVHPRTLSRWLREPTFYAEYRSRLE
jgi:transposase-like protein